MTSGVAEACAEAVEETHRRSVPIEPPLEWGGWALYRSERKLGGGKRVVRLSPMLARIVELFLLAKGEVRTRHFFAGSIGTNRATMRSHIKTLRKKIGHDAIRTVGLHSHGEGYRMAVVGEAADNPVEDLIDALELALKAAKRLRVSKRAEG